MAELSNFQRSSPLRTPIRGGKLKKQPKLMHHTTDVPPLARHLLRSLNNDRRNSLSMATRLSISAKTVRRDSCLLDQSCMNQFDDSFAPNRDAAQLLTPRKSPHLLRRGSLTRLGKNTCRQLGSSSKATGLSGIITGGIASSRKKFVGVRKRMMKLIPRRPSSGYSKLGAA
uniref:Uncharacterized protein n=1 Tax=Anopheles epiroticus TaxID=199890 RepID=A0A182PXC2_9DIPT